MADLASFLNSSLKYYVNLAEEQQLLSGDNVGEDLHGLIPQASAFNTGVLGPGGQRVGTKLMLLADPSQQITNSKELQPTFIVMHPSDWWDIRLTKDGFGRYILGDPQSAGQIRQ